MAEQKEWTMKGTFIACCRIEGHCSLLFGRDLWGPEGCTAFQTYRIEEGQIQDVDMKGLAIIFLVTKIGPKIADVYSQREGAIYVSDNASDEQRKVLETFLPNNMRAEMWKKCHGLKFVKIDIKEKDGVFNVKMPFGEQEIALTVGADGTPMRLGNLGAPLNTWLSNFRFANTHFWKYHDYGMNFEFQGSTGDVADFSLKGVW